MADDNRYAVESFGGCLGEWLPDGVTLVADPDMDIRPRDLCMIVFRDGDGPWARFMRGAGASFEGAVKLFLGHVRGEDGGLFLVGQMAPPAACIVPAAEVEALHRIVGVAGGGPRAMTPHDEAALSCVLPFAQYGAVAPVNPGWRPEPGRELAAA